MSTPDLKRRLVPPALEEGPETFPFFQAVRLLQRHLTENQSRVGEGTDPSREPVRFTANPSLAFPAGDIQDLRFREDGPPVMMVNFMGLVGHMGVLPNHYSRLVNQPRVLDPDPDPFRDFLDLFHHRIISAFYRAWERSHFFVALEREEDDWITSRLRDLLGLGTGGSRKQATARSDPFIPYTALLAAVQRSGLSLDALLEAFFDVPVEVEQFVGGWYRLSESHQCRIDDDFSLGGRLGEDAAIGDEIWDPQARVQIRVGPLTRDRYEEFLPGGDSWESLLGLLDFFGNGQVDFDVKLVLKREDVRGVVLGMEEDHPSPLGWCSWLCTRPRGHDADETVLETDRRSYHER